MRLFLLLAVFYSNVLFSQSSIYDLSIITASGKNVSLSEYKDRKIVIAAVSSDILQKEGAFSYWDSLQTANPKIVLILIPASDFTGSGDSVVAENPSGDIVLSESTDVKKDNGSDQNPIMQWLTDPRKNSHFNADVETDSQLYFISESGVLYAVLNKGVEHEIVDGVLKQADVKQQSVISAELQK